MKGLRRGAGVALVLITSTAPAGCGWDITGSDVDTWEGHYSFGFEARLFQPCGSEAYWWVVDTPDGVWSFIEAQPEFQPNPPSSNEPTGSVWVRWRGKKSEKGHFGHLNAFQRELRVMELLEIRMPEGDDCK